MRNVFERHQTLITIVVLIACILIVAKLDDTPDLKPNYENVR